MKEINARISFDDFIVYRKKNESNNQPTDFMFTLFTNLVIIHANKTPADAEKLVAKRNFHRCR